MTRGQITSRVTPKVKARFAEYAAELGLSDSELAKLLLLRESRQKQLKIAIETQALLPVKGGASSKSNQPTITAHYSSGDAVDEFREYVKSCSPLLSISVAAAWVLERELSERWLAIALTLQPDSIIERSPPR